MALDILNNLASLSAQQNLNKTRGTLSGSLERLSSGLKLNGGADGPAALASSEQLRSRISGINAALQSTSQSVAMVQTGDAALSQVGSLLNQIRGLVVSSANTGVNDANASAANQAEIDKAVSAVNQITSSTQFAGRQLFGGATVLGSGPGGPTLALPAVNASTLGTSAVDGTVPGDAQSLASITTGGANSVTGGDASTAAEIVDRAINQVATLRAQMGAFQSDTLETNAENLNATLENVTAAESEIRDTDYAEEVANFTKSQVKTQAGMMVLSQANRSSQLVLRLLQQG